MVLIHKKTNITKGLSFSLVWSEYLKSSMLKVEILVLLFSPSLIIGKYYFHTLYFTTFSLTTTELTNK